MNSWKRCLGSDNNSLRHGDNLVDAYWGVSAPWLSNAASCFGSSAASHGSSTHPFDWNGWQFGTQFNMEF